jgi:hypothetical protein
MATRQTKLTTIGRQECRTLRAEISEHLAEFAAAHGLAVQVGNAKYTANSVTFKLELALISEGGDAMTSDAEAFRVNAIHYGLNPADLFREFRGPRGAAKIIGLSTRSRKRPIIVEHLADGKHYKYDEHTIGLYLKAQDRDDGREETA